MQYDYYYNVTPEHGKVRNNLVYTSLISQDKKTFVQWYHNDSEYHKGQNQVVDHELMKDKWERELCFLTRMSKTYPDLVPEILDIDLRERKIYLAVDGVDFWQRSLDGNCTFDKVLPEWQDQMLDIIRAHHDLDMYKYSMHPSSYFIVDGQLKSINYFFAYSKSEGPISIAAHQSHLSENRQIEVRKNVEKMRLSWDDPQPLELLEQLCWESFRTNYPDDFIEKAKSA